MGRWSVAAPGRQSIQQLPGRSPELFDATRFFNTILEVWGEPRTYGITLSLNW